MCVCVCVTMVVGSTRSSPVLVVVASALREKLKVQLSIFNRITAKYTTSTQYATASLFTHRYSVRQ